MALLGACAVGPDYQPPATQTPDSWSSLPESTTTQPAGPTTKPADLTEWWKQMNDPTLDDLIERAVQSNFDLRIATARARQARAQRGIVSADLWPQVLSSASYAHRLGLFCIQYRPGCFPERARRLRRFH